MEKLTSEDDEVMPDDLGAVIRALPGQGIALIEGQLAPGECAHVELVHSIQFFLVESASPEQQHHIAVLIIVEGEVGAGRRKLAKLLNLGKGQGVKIETPEVVIVLRV